MVNIISNPTTLIVHVLIDSKERVYYDIRKGWKPQFLYIVVFMILIHFQYDMSLWIQVYLYVANEFVFVLLKNLPDGTSDFFFQNSLKKKKKCFACVRLSLEAGWSLISLWRIYDHVMKFDQSESPSSQQGIDAPCNYQRGKREENDGGGGAWSARYSLDIHYTVQKSIDLQYSIIETTLLIRSVLWSSWPKICKNENQNNRIQKCFTLLFSHNFLYFLAIQYFRII